jgi:hypothetical protein
MIYPGQLPLETDLLNTAKDAYMGLAKLAAAVLGTGTLVNGLSCAPTTPNSMSVVVGAGEIYALEAADQNAFSSLGTDSHSIVKQGVLCDPMEFTFIAPAIVGDAINYLIEAAFIEEDINPVVLRYYNSANPSQAFSGPSGTGAAQNTTRNDRISVRVVDGTPAAAGTQTTPAPDTGYTALWVVTVVYGQTSIAMGNIQQAVGAPFITERLGDKISQATGDGRYVRLGSLPVSAAESSLAPGELQVLISAQITTSVGRAVLVIASVGSVTSTGTSGGSGELAFVKRNGSQIGANIAGYSSSNQTAPGFSFVFLDSPGVGTFTYDIATMTAGTYWGINLQVLEI